MRAKRLVIIFAPFACVLFYVLVVRTLESDIPHSTADGERLRIASLAPGEEITVVKYFAHRGDPRVRQYHIGGYQDPTRIDVYQASATWASGRMIAKPEKLLASRSLTQREANGLDETISYFRKIREEHSSATRSYCITYLRSGARIGEEFFVGFSLPDQLKYLDDQGFRSDPAYDSDYVKLAEEHGTDRFQLNRMVTFEMLATEPNKAPEPTPGSVTPRATEGVSK